MPQRTKHEEPFTVAAAFWSPSEDAVQALSVEEALAKRGGEECLAWIRFDAHDHEASLAALEHTLGFSDLEAEDALSTHERPHLHENPDHLFFAAPAVRMKGAKVYYSEVGFYVAKGLLITTTTSSTPALDRWFERWSANSYGHTTRADFLLHSLLDAIVDDYYPVLDELEAQSDKLETEVFQGRPVQVKDLLRLKRRLLDLRRRLSPVRDILNGLLRRDCPILAPDTKPYFQDVYDHSLRVLETVDLNRDILASVLDAHLANISNRLNEIMRLLTVFATILMSWGVIAGWYGMNFKHMPELDWHWSYPALIGIMAMIAVAEWLYFKRKGWL